MEMINKLQNHHDDDDQYIFRSKLPNIYIPNHLPLHKYCFENISEFSTHTCLINSVTGAIYTYHDVELTAKRIALGLRELGIEQRDVIMLLLPNSPEFVFAFLGASFRGAISTTANPFYTSSEITKQAKASNVKLIVTQSCYVDKIKHYAEENEVKIVCTDESSALPDGCLSFAELSLGTTQSDQKNCCYDDDYLSDSVKILPDDVVALPYSSGTMGLPKGVMLTHKGLVTSVAQQVDGENPNLYFHSEDVIMCVLPLFHIYSLNSILLCGLRVGATILIMQKFEIKGLMELVEKYRVTIAPFVPPIVLAIAKSPLVDEYDLSSIRMIMSGAAPMGKELEDTVRAKLPNAILGQGYGMTEAGPVLSMCLAFAKQKFEVKSGSCGTVVRNAEMKIVDTNTGVPLPRNHAGEICIRGDQIMKGYLNNPKSTEETIDKEGWLHTGDIGYVDDDDQVFIIDRLKELIKYKGYQVAPAELEAMLISNPNIIDAAVVPMKDEVAGEVPVAFVVRANGNNISEDEIKQFISQQVIFYKRINRVFFTEKIPKAPSGKILRKDLRAKLSADLAS